VAQVELTTSFVDMIGIHSCSLYPYICFSGSYFQCQVAVFWQVASNVLYLCLSYALDYACVPDSLGGCCMDILPYEQFFFLTQQPAAELYSKLIFWHKTNTGPCANCFSLTKTHLNFQL
jgi:hypothetical protein